MMHSAVPYRWVRVFISQRSVSGRKRFRYTIGRVPTFTFELEQELPVLYERT